MYFLVKLVIVHDLGMMETPRLPLTVPGLDSMQAFPQQLFTQLAAVIRACECEDEKDYSILVLARLGELNVSKVMSDNATNRAG